jgi:D-arabinose 1-dehydrogenase-like Zn-dependent alcohol dehydrogenase
MLQMTAYPIVPGHEIVGIVTEVGSAVTKFKVGERAGVGCMVNSCRSVSPILSLANL